MGLKAKTMRRILLATLAAMLFGVTPGVGWTQEGLREEIKRRDPPKLTKPPKLLKFVEAEYPAKAREELIDGPVQLSLVIDETGKVTKVEVKEAPDATLGAAAEAAAWQFVFSPAEVDDKPSPIQVGYTYNFVLDFKFDPEIPRWAEDRWTLAVGKESLVGRVREKGTRLPLRGVALAIRERGVEVQSDDKGYFKFPDLPAGKYKVEANSLEHNKDEVEVEVVAGQQTRVTFYLDPNTSNEYETVVRGKRRQTAVTRVTLRQKELTTVPGTFGDPVRVVENLPGVNRLPFVGGGILIRGSAPSDSGVYLDGTEIPLIYHFFAGPSVLNPEFLDRIDYYPGNADARYGRLIAGVVDVQTRNTFTEQWGGALDINLLNASLMVKVPITDKVSIAGAIRRSYIDALLQAFMDSTGEGGTTVLPVYYDYQLRVDVNLGDDNKIFVLFFGSDDQMEIVSNKPEDDISIAFDTQTTFHRLLAGWRYQITPRLLSRLTPTLGYDFVSFDIGELKVEFTTFNFLVREDLEYRLSKAATLRFGADVLVEQMWADNKVPLPVFYRNPAGSGQQVSDELFEFKVDPIRLGIGLYVDGIFQLTDKLTLIPGARFDLYNQWGETFVSVGPRLTAKYQLIEQDNERLFRGTLLKGAVGNYSKAAGFVESAERFGNVNLSPENAVHASLGFEQQIYSALKLDLQGFFIWRYNMVVQTSEMRAGQGTPLYYTNQGEGYAWGLEVLLKHELTKRFYGWIAYTLSESKQRREPGADFTNFIFNQRHIFTLVASTKIIWGIEMGIRFRLVSGRWDTPILGGIYDNDKGAYTAITGTPFSEELPLFHQLDLRIEKTWLFQLWKLSLYLDIQNLYNQENREATLWDYRYNESGALPGIPILPTLGIKGSF